MLKNFVFFVSLVKECPNLHTQERYGFLLSIVEKIRTAVCFIFEYSTDSWGWKASWFVQDSIYWLLAVK